LHCGNGGIYPISMLKKTGILVDAQIHGEYNEQRINLALHSNVMMDNVSVCRIFSRCLPYILICSHVLIFTTVSLIPHNL